ncbi:MAG: hypothetical protein V1793_01960 [Pseudomonadota bacterium]
MLLVYGIALAAISVLLLGFCFIGARDPKKPKWAGDFLMGSVYVPGIIMLMILSLASFYWFVRNYAASPLTTGQGGMAVLVAIVSVIAWRFMGVSKKIKAYQDASPSVVISFEPKQESRDTDPPAPHRVAA